MMALVSRYRPGPNERLPMTTYGFVITFSTNLPAAEALRKHHACAGHFASWVRVSADGQHILYGQTAGHNGPPMGPHSVRADRVMSVEMIAREGTAPADGDTEADYTYHDIYDDPFRD